MENESKPDLTIPEMLGKLDLMMKRREYIENQVGLLYKEYEQLADDIDMAETIIMHKSNKEARKNEINNIFN